MLFCSLLISFAFAEPVRISSTSKNLSSADLISMSPGLATVIEFPKPIIEVRVGNTEILNTSISTVSPKELTLSLNQLNVATNLIVKSGSRIFVFDVVSSRSHHQDYLKISSSFGSPNSSNSYDLIEQGKLELKVEKSKTDLKNQPEERIFIK